MKQKTRKKIVERAVSSCRESGAGLGDVLVETEAVLPWDICSSPTEIYSQLTRRLDCCF